MELRRTAIVEAEFGASETVSHILRLQGLEFSAQETVSHLVRDPKSTET